MRVVLPTVDQHIQKPILRNILNDADRRIEIHLALRRLIVLVITEAIGPVSPHCVHERLWEILRPRQSHEIAFETLLRFRPVPFFPFLD